MEAIKKAQRRDSVSPQEGSYKVKGLHLAIDGGYSFDNIFLHLHRADKQQGPKFAFIRSFNDKATLSVQGVREGEPDSGQVNGRGTETRDRLFTGKRDNLATAALSE